MSLCCLILFESAFVLVTLFSMSAGASTHMAGSSLVRAETTLFPPEPGKVAGSQGAKAVTTRKSDKAQSPRQSQKTEKTQKSQQLHKTDSTQDPQKVQKAGSVPAAKKTRAQMTQPSAKVAPAKSAQLGKSALKTSSTQKQAGKGNALHGQPWAFGGGRSTFSWSRTGLDGDELLNQATGKKSTAKIDKARTEQKRGATDGISVSVDREVKDWHTAPGNELHPGEDVALDAQHRVRAFATMKSSDLSLGLGPEVIVRDQQSNHSFNPSEQPDVEPGVGMRLMLDF